MGGMLRAIESGYVQREIQESAYRYQREIESGETVVVGVNKHQMDEAVPMPILRVNADVERAQVERVGGVRARRDAAAADRALGKVRDAAGGTENLLPRLLDCVEAQVTVGEISNCLRSVWGEYREAITA